MKDNIIFFEPIYQERVWGGRKFETLYDRKLPKKGKKYGESWEISDREEANSLVKNGKLKGKTLNQLWTDKMLKEEIFGKNCPKSERFPLLIKILDAQEKLSVQVHPPQEVAKEMNCEAKTECWRIVQSEKNSSIYVGLKNGVSKDSFKKALDSGTVEECLSKLETNAGDFIQLESGRIHAIAEGNLIFEIQQNSDTTFRVFDWNRVGLDGKPRQLHINESLKSINFNDFEPKLKKANSGSLVSCDFFRVNEKRLSQGEKYITDNFCIIAIVSGFLSVDTYSFKAGDFFMVKNESMLSFSTYNQCTFLEILFPNL